MSVASGPCVRLAGETKTLASVLTQNDGETPALTAALYPALDGGIAGDALETVGREGGGRLSRCSSGFVRAMAAANRESLRLADEDEVRGNYEDLPSFTKHLETIGEAWLREGRWPRAAVGLQNRLVRLGQAREAEEKSLPLFVWHGPPVPQFVVVQGSGPYRPSK